MPAENTSDLEIDERVRRVFADILDLPEHDVSASTSVDNTPEWDSMASMLLVQALEEEFRVRLSDREVMQMTDVATVIEVVRSKKRR